MKILDRYILTSFLKTFISVFVILMLIFVLQTIWLYIKELAGKDLDIIVIFKYLFYFSPRLVPLVLPLTILLASIMVFGNFAENYEFAAMKASGISLQRAMRGLSVFIVCLAVVTFFFSNNVIPWGEVNSFNLRKNIAKLQPAMFIAEGQFNDVGDYNLKFDTKSGDNDQILNKVVIHQKSNNYTGNYVTIIAEQGELMGNEDSEILKLILSNGYYYNDTPASKLKDREKHPFVKSEFKTYTINIDLTNFNQVDLDEKGITNRHTMLSITELDKTIDTLSVEYEKDLDNFSVNMLNRSNAKALKYEVEGVADSTKKTPEDILKLFQTPKQQAIINSVESTVKSTMNIVSSRLNIYKNKKFTYNNYIIAMHEKLALGFACVILFFVGAPLGALIRKGGIGLPMVIAILLFLTYHFIGIFATNSAKADNLNPALAPWVSTLVMLPLGIYLTRRATKDRSLLETGNIKTYFARLFGFKSKK